MLLEDRLDALLSADLAGTRRPGARPGDDALEPLLVAAGALQPLRETRPSATFAAALEARLLARAASGAAATTRSLADPAALPGELSIPSGAPGDSAFGNVSEVREGLEMKSSSPPPRAPRRASSVRRPRFLWPAVAAALLLLAFGTLTVAASAGPGSPLYSLRRLEQGVRVALSGNPADRMRLHLGYASDALTAANAAARTGDNTAFGDALATLRSELDAATSELPSVPPGADHDNLAAQLTSLHSQAISGLRGDLPPLDWPSRLAATDALAAFGDTVPRVTSATAARNQDAAMHTWRIVVSGVGFAPGARLLVNGRPAGTVISVSNTTLIANYIASDGRPPSALGVANSDDTAAQTSHISLVPSGQGTPGPANTPGAGSDGHGGGPGQGGHGGGHGTPTPSTGG